MREGAGEATFTRVTRHEKNLRVVGAQHFSRQAALFFQEDILPEITNPSLWLFMIEGAANPTLSASEVGVARTIAREKGIPVVDPVFTPLDRSVVDAFSLTEGEHIPRSAILGVSLASIKRILELSSSKPFSEIEIVSILSAAFDMTLEEFVEELTDDSDISNSGPNREALTDDIKDGLVRISNILSTQALDYFLKQYPSRSEIAVYLGKGHAEIVEMKTEEIPDELKLTDEDVDALIQYRDALHQNMYRLVTESRRKQRRH